MESLFEDIYEYEFHSLYERIKTIIGRNTINFSISEEEKELDEIIGESVLLFDIAGHDFTWFKSCDSEYKYWVEVYILKIIKNMLSRKGIWYEERYHSEKKEQHSIVYSLNGKLIEAYFLFDVTFEESTHTDYDKIAKTLKAETKNVDEINIFIFRDRISMVTLANLINDNAEMNENGFVTVYPLHDFFDSFFGQNEYHIFEEYSNDFHSKCNNIISYKTVITPTKKTMVAFKRKKLEMLKNTDYKATAAKGQSGRLSDYEFEKVRKNFISNSMYSAMVSSNDFADSFISAEWSYDIYSNAMGDLELTGIIAGYLKSIEQLLYTITRFHRDQGFKIKTKNGHLPYTSEVEDIIDSTLGSLNYFVTSKEAKLAINTNIRGCIKTAVSLWTQFQRNGYLHKHNLYKSNNKIDEVRELTIYLYFLILGGIQFTNDEKKKLGVYNKDNEKNNEYSFDYEYSRFEQWFNNIIKYDLPETIPGIWFLLTPSLDISDYDNKWSVQPKLMKYFYIDDFENENFDYSSDMIEKSHVKDIPEFSWRSRTNSQLKASFQFLELFDNYKKKFNNIFSNISAVILESGKTTQLIHYKEK